MTTYRPHRTIHRTYANDASQEFGPRDGSFPPSRRAALLDLTRCFGGLALATMLRDESSVRAGTPAGETGDALTVFGVN
jgi:hypothetical protein